MSDEPGPPAFVAGPTLGYTTKAVTELCEATKDLLLFMRVQRLRCDHLEVTDKGVLIHGLVDEVQQRTSGPSRPPVVVEPSYERDYPEQ